MTDTDLIPKAHDAAADVRKTAHLAAEAIRVRPTTRLIQSYANAKDILRSSKVSQAGAGAKLVDLSRPEEISLFYIDGEPHRRRRAAVARYFTLRAIETHYQPIMEATAHSLLAGLVEARGGQLDKIAFRYAVAVAAEIIGLDHKDLEGLSARIEAMVNTGGGDRPTKDYDGEAVALFNRVDVDTATAARRMERRDDVISRLIDDGASDALIRTEVRGYAMAGMLTTREFIVIATWHLLSRPGLKQRFLEDGRAEQLAILEEIVRLEPPVGVLKRRVAEDIMVAGCERIPAGSLVAIDIRGANVDEAMAGKCPLALDPSRVTTAAPNSGFMSFGDGPHRCPGAQLAMHEARTFLDKLLRLSALTLVREPSVTWFKPISTYELNDAWISCGA